MRILSFSNHSLTETYRKTILKTQPRTFQMYEKSFIKVVQTLHIISIIHKYSSNIKLHQNSPHLTLHFNKLFSRAVGKFELIVKLSHPSTFSTSDMFRLFCLKRLQLHCDLNYVNYRENSVKNTLSNVFVMGKSRIQMKTFSIISSYPTTCLKITVREWFPSSPFRKNGFGSNLTTCFARSHLRSLLIVITVLGSFFVLCSKGYCFKTDSIATSYKRKGIH